MPRQPTQQCLDETYVKVGGSWRYLFRAIDQFGQVIDVFVSPRRDAAASRRFFERALGAMKITPVEVITDQPPTQSCWRSCCPRPGIAPTAMPITGSNAITVG